MASSSRSARPLGDGTGLRFTGATGSMDHWSYYTDDDEPTEKATARDAHLRPDPMQSGIGTQKRRTQKATSNDRRGRYECTRRPIVGEPKAAPRERAPTAQNGSTCSAIHIQACATLGQIPRSTWAVERRRGLPRPQTTTRGRGHYRASSTAPPRATAASQMGTAASEIWHCKRKPAKPAIAPRRAYAVGRRPRKNHEELRKEGP